MKLVIVGGTGFIGRPLGQWLSAAGHEVVVLTRRSPDHPAGSIRYAPWQPEAPGPWQGELDGAGGVVNLAGEPIVARRWTAEQKRRILESRVASTDAVVTALRAVSRKPAVLVNASAVGYYGPRGDALLSERDGVGGDFLAQVCQRWETAAQAAERLGVRVVRLRIGLVLANDGGVLAKMLPPFQWGLGGPLGNGQQWMSWIHRDDLLSLIRWSLEDSRVMGALNATAPNPVTMREFTDTLGCVLHRPSLARVPAVVLRLMLGEMAEMVLTGQRVVPEAALRLGFSFRHPVLRDALLACVSHT